MPLALSLLLARIGFSFSQLPAAGPWLELFYSTALCFSAILILPLKVEYSARSVFVVARNGAISVAIFLLAVILDPLAHSAFVRLAPLAAILFLMLLLFSLLVQAFEPRFSGTRPVLLVIVAALFSLPVWLGPLAEATGNSSMITNLIVGASPLSAFAVALDMDYLRTSWFYQNSALGSLRYDYLTWPAYLIILASAITALLAVTINTEVKHSTGLSAKGVTAL